MTANILDENILDDRPLTRATRERATKRHYLPTDREGGAKKKNSTFLMPTTSSALRMKEAATKSTP
jgi:hypothetical protein